jgi:hypothetical protein
MFAAVWSLIGVLYLSRGQIGEWRLLLPLLVIYAGVSAAIVASAPLRIDADAGSRSNKQWRAAVFLCLLLLTMLGIKWIRSA